MKAIRALSFTLLASLATTRAGLLVYEPFDYAPVNNEVFGRLAGRDGGLGFGAPWQDSSGGDAFIYDKRGNPENLYGGGWGTGKPAKHPEFAGTVFTADTRPFWRDVSVSPKEDGCHWNNNGQTLYLIGRNMGDCMAKMLKGK